MTTILVVDDEPGLRTVLSNILKSEGYNVIAVENGKKAIETVRLGNPDVMFLDIRLPDMDGLQILEEVKKINPGIPVIMCSGFDDVESAVRTVKMGAFDYISKPFKREEVLKAASKALEARGILTSTIPTVLPKEVVETKQKEIKKQINIFPIVVGVILVAIFVSISIVVTKNLSGTKIKVYPIPYSNPTALCWDGKNLWVSDWVNQTIYKHNIDEKLTVANMFTMLGSHITGLTFDGQYLWTCDSWARKIHKRNMDSNLSVVVTYQSPGLEPSGLFWDGINLWCCDPKEQKLYKLRVSLTELIVEAEYNSMCRLPAGMFSDGKYFWIADGETNQIFKLNIVDMSLAGIYSLQEYVEKGAKLSGIAYDGKYIWVCFDGIQQIFKYSKNKLKKFK